MKKIIATVGISNSGKSTWAHELWLENPDKFVIVNRDKIRELLFGFTEDSISEYYLGNKVAKYEKIVTRYEDTLINEALESGKVPIVDATHLTRKYLERFKYWNVSTDLVFFNVKLKEAQVRNMSRTRQVPEDILNKQYNQYVGLRRELETNPIDFTPVTLNQDLEAPLAFVFDIDGTLAHMNRETRSPYDWHKVGEDFLDLPTAATLRLLGVPKEVKIIICTGRDGVCIDETEQWLNKYDLRYDELYIRDKGDQRPDWVVKEEMWREIAKDNLILGLYDDRLQVVRRARALGLKVFNVEYNNF